MQKLKRLMLSALVALGISFGTIVAAPVAFAQPAHAYTSWFSEVIRCDYIDTYYNVDYNWWEEVVEGKRDYRMYIGTRYQYNWACHNVRF